MRKPPIRALATLRMAVGIMATGLSILAGASVAAEPASELPTQAARIQQLPRVYKLDGIVEAINKTTVSAQTAGQVKAVLFDVDALVNKDEVIVRLQDTQQKARVAQAEGNLNSARAALADAQTHFERIRKIFKEKAVSKASRDKAAATLKQAKGKVKAASAALAEAREQLSYTEVRAPYTGIVTERLVEPGEIAQPGKPLMRGLSLDRLRVNIDVPQSLIAQVRKHRKAQVQLPDSSWQEARMVTIFPVANQETDTFRVRLDLQDTDNSQLFPGMFVKAAIVTSSRRSLVIPRSAVVYRSEVVGVYVMDKQQQVHFRHIRPGLPINQDFTTVLSGVHEGEQICTDPIAAGARLREQLRERLGTDTSAGTSAEDQAS